MDVGQQRRLSVVEGDRGANDTEEELILAESEFHPEFQLDWAVFF